jgi:alkylation response protein AidB-like acyl-CoA dehydrogenase
VFEDGMPVIGPNGRQLVLGVWLPTDAIQLTDNWHALGLRSSGSTSYGVPPGTFVPESHCFDRYAAPDLSADPLNRHVELVFFSLVGVTLGMAEHVFDVCVAALLERMGGSGSQSLDSSTRKGLGEVAATVDAMRSHVYAVARDTDHAVFDESRVLTTMELARHRSTLAMAATLMRRVLEVATDVVGSRFVFEGHPIEKIIRDANTAFAHISSKRSQWADTGGAILDSLREHNLSPFAGSRRGDTARLDRTL